MKGRFLTVLISGVISCGIGWCDIPLKVVSFNIRYGEGKDGDNSWPNRKQVFANTLQHLDPDILGVQECLDYQAEFIAQSLPEYRWFGLGREADGSGEMAAVFYKEKILSPLEKGHFWLSETPEVPGSKSWKTACTRMVTWIHFRHRESGKEFYYFNTHFDHASEEARQQAAKLLLSRLEKLSPELPVIVTGDFNASAERSTPWETLTSGGLSDAWLKAEQKAGPEHTFGSFAPPKEAQKDRIDWILFKGPIKATRCETDTYNENGRYPSDHYPVSAELRLGE